MPRKRIDKKVKKIVKDYIQLLEDENFPIERIFIFGSRASGKSHQYSDSDIDVAIISPKLKNSLASMKFLLRKAHELDEEDFYIEPHVFHPNEFIDENPLVWEIKEKGIQLR